MNSKTIDKSKMIIEYVRTKPTKEDKEAWKEKHPISNDASKEDFQKYEEDAKKYAKGKKVGIIVALDPSHIGWSLCSKKDAWNPDKGFQIAYQRAKHPNRESIFEPAESVKATFNHVVSRSTRKSTW